MKDQHDPKWCECPPKTQHLPGTCLGVANLQNGVLCRFEESQRSGSVVGGDLSDAGRPVVPLLSESSKQ